MGAGLVALAAVLWGLSGGLGGLLMEAGWPPLLLSFHRAAFGLACILAWLMLVRPMRSRHGRRRHWAVLVGWSVVAGLGVAGNFAFYFLSISAAGVAVAASLMYSAPVFVFLVSFVLRLERLTPLKAAAVLSVVAGIVLLTESHRATLGAVTPFGIVTGLLAGLSYALFIFGFKAASGHGAAPQVLAIALGTVMIVLLPLIDHATLAVSLGASDLPWFILLGVMGAGISFVAYITGLRRTPPTVVAVLAMVEPVTAAVFGTLFLGESLSRVQVGGMGIILATVAMLGARRSA